MKFTEYIEMLQSKQDLERTHAQDFLGLMLEEEKVSDEQVAEALTLLTDKGVKTEEILGFLDAMKARMIKLPYEGQAIDTCGTGGDKSGTFNISTASAILLAAGGVTVAKHGNRAASSKCGSADVLETLGIPVDLAPDKALKALQEHGFAFLFAQLYHPALKRLAIVRKSLGFPTVFNLLGPLLNPAGVKRQVVGTFSLENAKLLSSVMSQMNYEHALVITSDDGLDEAGLAAPVHVFEVKGKNISRSQIKAADFGLETASIADLAGGDASENAEIITGALEPSENLDAPQRVIALNAGLGFYVAGKAPTIAGGVDTAKEVLNSGKAAQKLAELKNG